MDFVKWVYKQHPKKLVKKINLTSEKLRKSINNLEAYVHKRTMRKTLLITRKQNLTTHN